jgi:hypothetical protein
VVGVCNSANSSSTGPTAGRPHHRLVRRASGRLLPASTLATRIRGLRPEVAYRRLPTLARFRYSGLDQVLELASHDTVSFQPSVSAAAPGDSQRGNEYLGSEDIPPSPRRGPRAGGLCGVRPEPTDQGRAWIARLCRSRTTSSEAGRKHPARLGWHAAGADHPDLRPRAGTRRRWGL